MRSEAVAGVEQFRENVQLVKNFRPLSPQQQQELAKTGPELAAEWGPHFGPVTEEEKAEGEAES